MSGKQFWLGPVRAGQVVRFWASVDLIHLFIGGTRVKTVRSHLSVTDLARLVTQGAQNAGPSPLPPIEPGDAVEVERVVSKDGNISLAGKVVLAAEILGGQRVGIRIEPDLLMIYDLDSRELLRTRPNPLTHDQVRRLRGNRPAGPPPRPSVEPVRVQRRASNTGVIMRLRPEGRARPDLPAPDADRARLRDHLRGRARRRRDPRGAPDHHHPGP